MPVYCYKCNDCTEEFEVKHTVIKKTNKVIFLKTIIIDSKKNNSQITSVWSLNDKT